MFDFHKNHRILVNMAIAGFLILSLLIAVMPASQMQKTAPLSNQMVFTEMEQEGLRLYIAEGCVACHTQQVRSIEMDNVWGDRPSMPSDYYFSKQRLDVWRQSPSLLGSERTGPDLTNIGKRQPVKDWHLMHLYNPRSVVKESIMPSYPWLFEEKATDKVTPEDVIVPVGSPFLNKPNTKIVASTKALQLVAYLQSLKQTEMPGSSPTFIPQNKKEVVTTSATDPNQALLPDGAKLYANDPSPEMMIKVILMGYDARSEFAQMPPFTDQLSNEEIAAIANHERTSWGNDASTLSAEDVKKIRDMVNQQNP